ncbi:hypothetical protein BH11BAC2_BH11BAC2_26300 [soil metagenome]
MYHIKILLCFVFLAFASCAGSSQPEQRNVPTNMIKPAKTIAIDLALLASDRDLVCGMNIKNAIADTATVDGKLYGFCSEGCRKDFVDQHRIKDTIAR